jgi:hypothetical protein
MIILLMVINAYWCLLVIILLMVINDYFIDGY